jgi:integrase
LTLYLNYARDYYEPGERGWEYKNLTGTLVPIGTQFGGIEATKFGPLALKEVQQWLVAKGHSRSFVNVEISHVRRAFRWAVSEQLLQPAVLQGLQAVQPLRRGRSVAQDRSERVPVEWETVCETLAYLSPAISDMVSIQWYTGVRGGSLCQMRQDQFDLSADPWIWRPRHKTEHLGTVVEIPLGPRCRRIVERYIDRDGYLFVPRDARKHPRYRDHYRSSSYYNHIMRAVARANSDGHEIPRWHPHQIRHARERIVERLFGVEGARAALAHASLDATKIYSHRDLELCKRIAGELG